MNKLKRSKKKTSIFLIITFCFLILLAGLTYYFYYQSVSKKIVYTQNETIKFTDFDITLTKVQVKAVDLPVNTDIESKYGKINQNENCTNFSNTQKPLGGYQFFSGQPTTTDRTECEIRNNARKDIAAYQSKNRQLVVDYQIYAKNNVNLKKVSIKITPDSGREVEKTNDYDVSYPPFYSGYIAYTKGDSGKYLNVGLSRKSYIWTDIRNNEKVIDFVITDFTQKPHVTKLFRLNT